MTGSGQSPATPSELLDQLEAMGIKAKTKTHPPVFTVEEAQALKGELPGAHTKNLFLRDKKGVMWLVVALHDAQVDLRKLAGTLGTSGRLSFGSPERLMRVLGVTPGAVTPFGVVNDSDRAVTVALDSGIRGFEFWNAHPLDNAMTTTIRVVDMLRFLEDTGHSPVWVDLADPLLGDHQTSAAPH